MAIRVTDAARPGIQRRWAQAYAELGDARSAVRYLEPLLQQHTLVTVQSLATRISWAPIRNDPEFRALLDRYR